ncbi:MAG TPA: phage holin family protein [Candidatus Paceibacterota bacterium]|nr:phage holin family protein [Candidatus Paceibacterota bacterium]
MSSILHWTVSALFIVLLAYLIPGVDSTLTGAFLAALVIGLINVFIRPVISVLTLPVNIITLGIFSLIVNALLIMIAAEIVPGFSVSGFWAAFFFAIILAVITSIFGVGKNGPLKQ